MTVCQPTQDFERELLRQYDVVVGMDEVGRGALAGPLAVGVAVVEQTCGTAPTGLADSKLLTPARRVSLVSPIESWLTNCSIGWATPQEITAVGITAALRLAGLRAVSIVQSTFSGRRACLVLDGNHNWLKEPERDLFTCTDESAPRIEDFDLDIYVRVKADRDVSVVAAASVLAKVRRDRYMSTIADPGYDWARNKGYASKTHVEALHSLGPSRRHRLGWNLPGVDGPIRSGGEA